MAKAWNSRGAIGPLARATTRRRALGLLGGLAAIGMPVPVLSARQATPAADEGWTMGTDAAWGNVDRATPNSPASVGEPEPDLEAMLGLNPDLFVTFVWGDEETPCSWSVLETEAYERAGRVAPVVGISAAGRADANMIRFAELAASLGADLESPELTAARATYEEQAAAFPELAQEKADLASLFASSAAESIFIAHPTVWADLAMYEELGLNLVHSDIDPKSYWEELSAEQAIKYPADIFFESARPGIFTPEELAAHATYGSLPAVKAGQIAPWNQDFIQSHQGLTAALETIVTALKPAEDVTA